jgi:hypothetical protein
MSQEDEFRYAFDFPTDAGKQPIKLRRLRLYLWDYFGIQLIPAQPPVPFESLTAGQLSDWVLSTIDTRTAQGETVVQPHHLYATAAALQSAGADMRGEPLDHTPLAGKFPRLAFRRKWQQTGDSLGVRLPAPESSALGCVVSLIMAGVIYVLFLMWFDKVVPGVGRGMKRALGWLFFVGAVMLFGILTKLLAFILPDFPHAHDTVAKLARALASEQKPLPAGIKESRWTADHVWRTVRSIIARAYNVQPSSITRQSVISSL